jgi:hypothetical protein
MSPHLVVRPPMRVLRPQLLVMMGFAFLSPACQRLLRCHQGSLAAASPNSKLKNATAALAISVACDSHGMGRPMGRLNTSSKG